MVFALTLGLIAFLYLGSAILVIGVQLDAVRVCAFYPRALLTPFTDHVQLTDADRRAYSSYARMQRFKGFEHIEVTFGQDGEDGG